MTGLVHTYYSIILRVGISPTDYISYRKRSYLYLFQHRDGMTYLTFRPGYSVHADNFWWLMSPSIISAYKRLTYTIFYIY